MNFYCKPHRFYCGVDLHTRTMYLCILDQAGHPSTGMFDAHRLRLGDDHNHRLSSPDAPVVEVSPDGMTLPIHSLIYTPLVHAPDTVGPAVHEQHQTAADHGHGCPEPPALLGPLHRLSLSSLTPRLGSA